MDIMEKIKHNHDHDKIIYFLQVYSCVPRSNFAFSNRVCNIFLMFLLF